MQSIRTELHADVDAIRQKDLLCFWKSVMNIHGIPHRVLNETRLRQAVSEAENYMMADENLLISTKEFIDSYASYVQGLVKHLRAK